MIEFKGEISEECLKYLHKKETNDGRILGSIMSSIAIIVVIIIACTWRIEALILAIMPIVFFIMVYIPQKGIEDRAPKRISIEENLLVFESEKFSAIREIEEVKAVIDLGDWYYISLYFPHKWGYYVCQKDLITQGTLEEFEALFEDKLVRRIDD